MIAKVVQVMRREGLACTNVGMGTGKIGDPQTTATLRQANYRTLIGNAASPTQRPSIRGRTETGIDNVV